MLVQKKRPKAEKCFGSFSIGKAEIPADAIQEVLDAIADTPKLDAWLDSRRRSKEKGRVVKAIRQYTVKYIS